LWQGIDPRLYLNSGQKHVNVMLSKKRVVAWFWPGTYPVPSQVYVPGRLHWQRRLEAAGIGEWRIGHWPDDLLGFFLTIDMVHRERVMLAELFRKLGRTSRLAGKGRMSGPDAGA
jgi:hypothetical protein